MLWHLFINIYHFYYRLLLIIGVQILVCPTNNEFVKNYLRNCLFKSINMQDMTINE